MDFLNTSRVVAFTPVAFTPVKIFRRICLIILIVHDSMKEDVSPL